MSLRIRLCVAASCTVGLLSSNSDARGEQVSSALATFNFKIDRQPLDGALQQLAKQCDLQVVYFSRVTEGIAAPAIDGQFTLDSAMDQLLAGSRLTFRVIDAKTVEVRPRQARPMARPRMRESAEKQSPDSAALREIVVVGLAEQLVATRMATSLREIPQTVSIVTREQTRQQDSIDLGDVLSHVPGITTTRVNSLDREYYSRGFQITSLHVDGGSALDPWLAGVAPIGLIPAELSEFDHIEVMRGSDALFSGNGNPGGTLSLMRKLPQRAFALETNASAGSWDQRRIEIDITGPIALDGALRARADAVYSRSDFFYDSASFERTKVFAVMAWDPAPDATLSAGGSYQSDNTVPSETGVPRNADGSDAHLSRETSFVFDWQRQSTRTTEGYLQYRQMFPGDWNLKVNAAGWRTTAEKAGGYFLGPIDAVTQGLGPPTFNFNTSPVVIRQVTADAILTGVLDWFGLREEIAIGADSTWIKSEISSNEFDSVTPLPEVGNFDPAAYPDPRLTGIPSFEIFGTTRREQYGAFASMRVYFDDAWSVVAGARIAGATFDSEITARFFGIDFTNGVHTNDSRIVTPYAGLMYNVDEHLTVYASYADIYGDSSEVLRPDGRPIDVKHGVTFEAGVKGQWRDGALNGSLVMYRIAQTNSLLNMVDPIPGVEYDGICCLEGETSRSEGVDLELSGEIRHGWNLGWGYSFNENEQADGSQYSQITPKHLFKAWTSLRLPESLTRWTVGGSLHAQSRITFNRSPEEGGVPGLPPQGAQQAYVVLDLRVGFAIDSNWQLAMSVNNALDKTYYESIGLASWNNWYGEPRNVAVRIDGRF